MQSIDHKPAIRRRKAISYAVAVVTGIALVSTVWMSPAVQAEPGVPESFTALAEMASPTVVNISTITIIKGGGRGSPHFLGPHQNDEEMKEFFDRFFGGRSGSQREFRQRSLGSGFIIGKDGFIVTNDHVIKNADTVKVILTDGKEYEAEVVGRDSTTDLALIKIQPDRDLPVIHFGDSEALRVGQWVVAIGNPFGLDHTVTAGIVSAKGRVIGSGPYDDFIQTDASINPGNSGGPLLNMKGEVVGINTAISAGGQGIGFAIPINLAKGVIRQLKDHGRVTRGWLGVAIQNVSDELAEYYGLKDRKGVLVNRVFPGDPADEAGIRANDIILSINGRAMGKSRELTALIADIGVGDVARITVYRGGTTKTFKVKIGQRDDSKRVARGIRRENSEDNLGIKVAEITPGVAQRFNLTETEGLIVMGISPGSKGSEAEMRIGDIIKEINHRPIQTVDDYKDAIREIKKDEAIRMYVLRRGGGHLIVKMVK
ncbi:MAG: DegQ family serine endoprotease [Desulfobacterales bacterium]